MQLFADMTLDYYLLLVQLFLHRSLFVDLKVKLQIMAKKNKEELIEMGRNSSAKILKYSYDKFCLAVEKLLSEITCKAA